MRDTRRLAALAAGAAILLAPFVAHAHLVTGKLSGAKLRGEGDTLFVFRADVAVAVDTIRVTDGRDFVRVLAPGKYRVEIRDRKGVLWTGELIAEDEPVHRNVHLRKANK